MVFVRPTRGARAARRVPRPPPIVVKLIYSSIVSAMILMSWIPRSDPGEGLLLPAIGPLYGAMDQFHRVFQTQLGLDVRPVRLDGADAQMQFRGDAARGV